MLRVTDRRDLMKTDRAEVFPIIATPQDLTRLDPHACHVIRDSSCYIRDLRVGWLDHAGMVISKQSELRGGILKGILA